MTLLLALGLYTIAWADLPPPAQHLASELGLSADKFPAAINTIRTRNAARLREGEIDHLIFYMLQSREFTSEAPIDPAQAAMTIAIRRRMADFAQRLAGPRDERQKYFATLVEDNRERFLERETARVLRWIREKEVGCRSAPSPQACIAALYVSRGHSSDTRPQSMVAVRAAFEWLRRDRNFAPKRILIVGPGADFAPRTSLKTAPVTTYQPRLTRDLAQSPVQLDCVDLNPRVLKAAAGECDATELLDIAVEKFDRKYDVVIATNVLLYLDQTELLLALRNARNMLEENGAFIHNDSRFETQLFGRAVGLPVKHSETVTLQASKRTRLIDRLVIHSPAQPKL